jgi:ectoine hydroxylase-related dioxygenase (phytanoyl-CoA dioxygenase family)
MLRMDVQEQGFAIESYVVSQAEITQLLDELQVANLPRSRAGIRHALQHPSVARIARDTRLLALAQAILGSKAIPFRATLFDKSPLSNWLVAWHQDTALPLQYRREVVGWGPWSLKDDVIYAHAPASALTQVLALRLHLDDSRAENGPLRVLPGTHLQDVLTDEEMSALAGKISPVECTVNTGGVLLMRPLLVHASSKSRSELPRRVLHIEYAAQQEIAEGFALAIA